MAVFTQLEVKEILTDPDILTEGTVEVFDQVTYDPTTGSTTEGTGTDYTVNLVPPYQVTQYMWSNVASQGDWVTWFDNYSLSFTPAKGQRLTFNSTVWFIDEVNSYNAGGTDIVLWEVGLRK